MLLVHRPGFQAHSSQAGRHFLGQYFSSRYFLPLSNFPLLTRLFYGCFHHLPNQCHCSVATMLSLQAGTLVCGRENSYFGSWLVYEGEGVLFVNVFLF